MSSIAGSDDAISFNNENESQLVRVGTAEPLFESNQNNSFGPPESDATAAQSSIPSQSAQRPNMLGAQNCISSVGNLYQNAQIRHSMLGSKQVTDFILGTEEPTPGSVLIVQGREGHDWDASSLVVDGEASQQRYSFRQLGVVAHGKVKRGTGWLVYGDDLPDWKPGAWNPKGLMIWGDHQPVDNGDGTSLIRIYH